MRVAGSIKRSDTAGGGGGVCRGEQWSSEPRGRLAHGEEMHDMMRLPRAIKCNQRPLDQSLRKLSSSSSQPGRQNQPVSRWSPTLLSS